MEFASTITSYSWYAEGINYPVLTITSIVSPSLINDQVVIQSGPYDPAAVLDSKFANSIALSPNPANDHFILKFHNQKSNATMVYIKDASGKTLQITNIGISDNAHAINISDLESGLYFVEIESDGLKAVKKLVKN